jgi:hypothetical protein
MFAFLQGTSDAAMPWWKINLDCFVVGPANPRRRSWHHCRGLFQMPIAA